MIELVGKRGYHFCTNFEPKKKSKEKERKLKAYKIKDENMKSCHLTLFIMHEHVFQFINLLGHKHLKDMYLYGFLYGNFNRVMLLIH